MANLSELFKKAGITAEEFRKYFLEPAYPNQNAAIINNIVFTEETDETGKIVKVEKGTLEEVATEFPELLLKLVKDKEIEEEIVEWLAHNRKKELDHEIAQSESSVIAKTGKRILARVLGGLVAVIPAFGDIANRLLPGIKDGGAPSAMAEGRILAEEQHKRQQEIDKGGGVELMAELTEAKLRQETKTLAKEINIIDAVYDNKAFIMAMQIETEEMMRQQNLSMQELDAAKAMSSALRSPENVKGVGITANRDIAVQYRKNDELQRSSVIIRVTGRLAALRDRISQKAAEFRGDNLNKALSGVGSVSLGSGGRDADKIERSTTPNEEERKKDRSKEIS